MGEAKPTGASGEAKRLKLDVSQSPGYAFELK